jgi:hypothetical protein
VDLNHRPLDYEFVNTLNLKELRGVIGNNAERCGIVRNNYCGVIVGVIYDPEWKRLKQVRMTGRRSKHVHPLKSFKRRVWGQPVAALYVQK